MLVFTAIYALTAVTKLLIPETPIPKPMLKSNAFLENLPSIVQVPKSHPYISIFKTPTPINLSIATPHPEVPRRTPILIND